MATSKTRILSADDIWAAKDIEEREVDVPQWGGAVRIKTFSKKQAEAMRKRATVKDRVGNESLDNAMLEALLFTEGVIEPKFALDDYDRVQEKSAVAVGTVLKAIMDASGLSQLAVTEATKSAEAGSNGTVRVSPGAGTEDDSRGAAAADVGA